MVQILSSVTLAQRQTTYDIGGVDDTRSNPGQHKTSHTRQPAPQDSQRMAHISPRRVVLGYITSSCSRKVTAAKDSVVCIPICQLGNRIHRGEKKVDPYVL